MRTKDVSERKRKPGRKANYKGATPKQVARALYWHRRRKPDHLIPNGPGNRVPTK